MAKTKKTTKKRKRDLWTVKWDSYSELLDAIYDVEDYKQVKRIMKALKSYTKAERNLRYRVGTAGY